MYTVREFMNARRRKSGERRVQHWIESRRFCSAQGDQSIANQAGAAFRADLNAELQALVTNSSGAAAPGTTYAHQWWFDTTTNTMKKRNAANSGWIVLGTLDETFVISRAANTILGLSDRGKTIVATAGYTQTLTAAATLGDGWCVGYRIESGATIVIDPNGAETIDGAATKSIIGLSSGMIYCNGTAFFTSGFASGSSLPTQTSNSGKYLTTDGTTASWAQTNPPVRQTILSGPVDTNGLAAFVGATGSGTVTATGTLIATAANGSDISGSVNRTGSITNPSWTGLTTNGTMYLGLTVAADGTCTTFSSTLAPTYRWGGADVVTANQRTYNIQEMQMKVGSGAAAAQAYDVFVGQVTVAGGVVTAITWYALMGRYRSALTATLPGVATSTSFNHNVGINVGGMMGQPQAFAQCTTNDNGWLVGDVMNLQAAADGAALPILPAGLTGALTAIMQSGSGSSSVGWRGVVRSGGASFAPTIASWSYFLTLQRGW